MTFNGSNLLWIDVDGVFVEHRVNQAVRDVEERTYE